MAQPTTENLARVGELLATRTLKVPIQARYSLAQAGEALQALGTSHTQGKRALEIG